MARLFMKDSILESPQMQIDDLIYIIQLHLSVEIIQEGGCLLGCLAAALNVITEKGTLLLHDKRQRAFGGAP